MPKSMDSIISIFSVQGCMHHGLAQSKPSLFSQIPSLLSCQGMSDITDRMTPISFISMLGPDMETALQIVIVM